MAISKMLCEICVQPICDKQTFVRVGGELIAVDSSGAEYSLMDNKIRVYAVFHTNCVESTSHRADCHAVPFIQQARSLISNLDSCAPNLTKSSTSDHGQDMN